MVNVFFKITWKRVLLFFIILILLNLLPFRLYPCKRAINYVAVVEQPEEWIYTTCDGALIPYAPLLNLIFMEVGGGARDNTFVWLTTLIISYILANVISTIYIGLRGEKKRK